MMQTFLLSCPKCSHEIKADKSILGQDVECPVCQESITLPSLEETDAPPEAPAPDESCNTKDETPHTPEDEVTKEEENHETPDMSLSAFRSALRANNNLSTNLKNKEFSEQLCTEASKIKKILES